MRLRLGTRASLLARTQAQTVADALSALGADVELVGMRSDGDVTRASLASLGGTGVFAAALRESLLAGEFDLVVHSYKDLPTAPSPGLRVAATPAREDHRDVLCAAGTTGLAQLPRRARVGTGSPRRRAQLCEVRPDLQVVDIRGNIDTRLSMVADGALAGVVLAAAGLRRIGRWQPAQVFEWPTAPAQGALAVEVREDSDPGLLALLAQIDDAATSAAVTAERTVLATLEAGCAAPVAATAVVSQDGLRLTAHAYAPDGSASHVDSSTGPVSEAQEIGRSAANRLLDAGARDWLGS